MNHLSHYPIRIDYYVGKNRHHASRYRHIIPRKGDEVRLRTGCYKVVQVCWHEGDTDRNADVLRVAIRLKKIKEAK